jgi:UDP-N-acetylglucosamine 2-epimerase
MQDDFRKRHPDQCILVSSLGYIRYLSAMKLCEAVIGNSSSGLLEAPAFRVPTVNIGDRQKGRIRTLSVVDCQPDKKSILNAVNTILKKSFRSGLSTMVIPFEKPGTAKKIKEILETVDLKNIHKKEFFDMTKLEGQQ